MHSTVTKLIPCRLLVVCQSKTIKMEALHQHQLRPKVYYQIGSGWKTDRLHYLRNVNKKNNR